ncbi:alpha/beta hydrolase [Allokutzneria sp. A3M-2-11 16]|uniref:alpha/beta fold hydrolase n=1 Tax=Allokutzneria sp. A3M-2-11 16 TaxID=2962043 RepID=UPI0020B6886E|nr:alpha/beta fold hydrolase [Allokutzneria sp. A3M-2-11 16]MCP3803387.1 alpha/beta hydrolase [Allokutzneria sp. A3M-2-11 16]
MRGVASAQGGAPDLSWKACAGEWQAPRVECADVEVPVDWERPGKKIALTVGRLGHTGTGPSKGVVLSIPGGPGGSGIMDLRNYEASFTELRKDFDVVSFDRRGLETYDHLPQECHEFVVPFTVARTRAEFDAMARSNKEIMAPCRAAGPELIDRLDAATVARDIDAMRIALGQQKLRLLANSYGGVNGTTYARLYPHRVAGLVMDGGNDHISTRQQFDRDRVELTKAQFGDFTSWCAANSSCALHGRDVRAEWRGLVEKADREPVPVSGTSERMTSVDLQRVVRAMLTVDVAAQQLSEAMDRAIKGDARGFYDATGMPRINVWLVSAMCGDGEKTWQTYEDYRRALEHAKEVLPEFLTVPMYGGICTGMDVPVRNPRAALTGLPLPPILGVGATKVDIGGPRHAVAQVPGSGLISFEGYGHTLYHRGNRCVIEHVDRYFRTGEVTTRTCPA